MPNAMAATKAGDSYVTAERLLFALALVPQLLVYQVLNGRPAPSATVGGKLVWCSPHLDRKSVV